MPILNDIMDHDVIGPAIRQGREQGMQQGIEQGRQEGRQEGMQQVVRHQIAIRFGCLPKPLESRFMQLTAAELDELALRVIDARTMEDLFSSL